MVRVGLSGGIGSGKSTVSAQLAALGAVVIDADAVAREVVGPGSDGLAAVVERFGPGVLAGDGRLDRPALARLVFADDSARRDLEAITHPRIAARTRLLLTAAPPDAVVVHDVPLLVEKHLGPDYHLVVVVGADEEVRLRRLVGRGMSPADARARMAAQASDEQRRAAADVWLDNGADRDSLSEKVAALWHRRLVPFSANLMRAECSRRSDPLVFGEPDQTWPAQAARLIERITVAMGAAALRVDHIGSTSVPGLLAKDVIDLQVAVRSLAQADEPAVVQALTAAGFPRLPGTHSDNPHPTPHAFGVGPVNGPSDAAGSAAWPKRMHGNADPCRVTHIHLHEVGSPGWRWALLFRDWLRADAEVRQDYAKHKMALAGQGLDTSAYGQAKERWFHAAAPGAEDWGRRTGWRPHRGSTDG